MPTGNQRLYSNPNVAMYFMKLIPVRKYDKKTYLQSENRRELNQRRPKCDVELWVSCSDAVSNDRCLELKQNSTTEPCLHIICKRKKEEKVQKTADYQAECRAACLKSTKYATRINLKRSEYSKLYQLSFKMAENKV